MTQTSHTTSTPEQRELLKKQAELASLETELVQAELELATIKAELANFEALYLRVVAGKQAELDRIEAQIAALLAELAPQDVEARQSAETARSVAEASTHTVNEASREPPRAAAIPTDDLKTLFRQAAKQVHPDLASTDKERERRHKVMSEVNQAYREGDGARLETILRDWHTSPEEVSGDGTAADLVRAIRRIAQAQNRLAQIAGELSDCQSDPMHELFERKRLAATQDRDYLAELATVLDEKIRASNDRLNELRRKAGRKR